MEDFYSDRIGTISATGTATRGFTATGEYYNTNFGTVIQKTIIGEDCIEVVYKVKDIWPEKIYKIIYSCQDGKWNKSEKIYGKIIPATEESYEFEEAKTATQEDIVFANGEKSWYEKQQEVAIESMKATGTTWDKFKEGIAKQVEDLPYKVGMTVKYPTYLDDKPYGIGEITIIQEGMYGMKCQNSTIWRHKSELDKANKPEKDIEDQLTEDFNRINSDPAKEKKWTNESDAEYMERMRKLCGEEFDKVRDRLNPKPAPEKKMEMGPDYLFEVGDKVKIEDPFSKSDVIAGKILHREVAAGEPIAKLYIVLKDKTLSTVWRTEEELLVLNHKK